jgi:hypothetical protein
MELKNIAVAVGLVAIFLYNIFEGVKGKKTIYDTAEGVALIETAKDVIDKKKPVDEAIKSVASDIKENAKEVVKECIDISSEINVIAKKQNLNQDDRKKLENVLDYFLKHLSK